MKNLKTLARAHKGNLIKKETSIEYALLNIQIKDRRNVYLSFLR